MVQWTNLQQIEKFVNRTRLYLTWRPAPSKTGSYGRLAGLPSVHSSARQTKFGLGLKSYKLAIDQNIQFSALFSQDTALFQQL